MSNQNSEQVAFLRLAPRFQVNNLEHALKFYGNLGFSITYNDGSLIILNRDGVELHMHYDPDTQPSRPVFWIEVKNIEELYQKCRENLPANCVSSNLGERPWGFKEFHITDPFRNLILFDEKI